MKLAVPVLIILALVPVVASTYQTQLLTYGLTLAIAALGFNLLLGYTGLVSSWAGSYARPRSRRCSAWYACAIRGSSSPS